MRRSSVVGRGGDSGFTLVEMAIVLVIIGLIIGGILVGQDLIKVAQLRHIAKTVENINAAVNTFRGKYNCLPGDCAEATNFFPARADCVPGDNVLVIEANTCNGNGDGMIGGGSFLTDPVAPESFLFWQHLSDAGLVSGEFSGKAFNSYQDPIPNLNVPSLNFRGGALIDVFAFTSFQEGSQGFLFSSPTADVFLNRHVIQMGVNYGNQLSRAGDFAFSSNEARQLDVKLDDGNGMTGNLRATTRAGTCQDGTGHYLNSDTVSSMQAGQLGCSIYIGAAF